jgi:hypothetical protein
VSEDRTSFNAESAQTIATAMGIPSRSDGSSARFSYFTDNDRFLVVAGAQEGDHVQLALAYGMTWAGTRRLVLALPADHSLATSLRLPWFREDRRPELWLHDDDGVRVAPELDRAQSVAAYVEGLAGRSPEDEFRAASRALHLGVQSGTVDVLVDWATRHDSLDAAHRQGERAWHCAGQRVLSVRPSRAGLRILAGIHGSADDRAPLVVEVTQGDGLGAEQFADIRTAVENAVDRRLTPGGDFHRPDEHWLQSVIRRRPSLVGVEQPALREVPAWRPSDSPGRWRRGYVDLVGLDGHGDIRLVEIKLATNDDPLLALQGLDYLIWAHAYRAALGERLGAPADARLTMRLVVGADEDGGLRLSRFTPALLEALDDSVDWAVEGVETWFGPEAEPRSVTPSARSVPVEWVKAPPASGDAFRDGCRAAAERWKARTSTLPDEARAAAPYWGGDASRAHTFCLPGQYASYNLLPDVREQAITLFARYGIPWHRGIDGGPGNHLLSSQVQCVNALMPAASDPERLKKAFGGVLSIETVLPIEDGRHVTFEFIGSDDVLGESRGGRRTRGANNTSVDAAFLYRTPAGTTELALIEWKYTEEYRRGRPYDAVSDVLRRQRYERLLTADDSPVRSDLVDLDDLLVEPFYQLMRQQLFAHELEKRRELGSDAVRVVHVLSADNIAYQKSLTRDSHRRVGQTVDGVWSALLRTPDRFFHVDPRVFLDPAVTSPEYVERYTAVGQRL